MLYRFPLLFLLAGAGRHMAAKTTTFIDAGFKRH
jgi:hypothetical protein